MAVQEKIINEKLVENSMNMGNYLHKLVELKLKDSKIIGEVRGAGTFQAVEFVKNKETKEPFEKELDLGHLIANRCFAKGLQIMGMDNCIDGDKGDHILFSPSYVITKEEVEKITKKEIKEIL